MFEIATILLLAYYASNLVNPIDKAKKQIEKAAKFQNTMVKEVDSVRTHGVGNQKDVMKITLYALTKVFLAIVRVLYLFDAIKYDIYIVPTLIMAILFVVISTLRRVYLPISVENMDERYISKRATVSVTESFLNTIYYTYMTWVMFFM